MAARHSCSEDRQAKRKEPTSASEARPRTGDTFAAGHGLTESVPTAHGRLPPFTTLDPVNWTTEAEQRLKEVPFFVRPAVRRKIEKLAGEAGLEQVDGAFYDQARASFGQS